MITELLIPMEATAIVYDIVVFFDGWDIIWMASLM